MPYPSLQNEKIRSCATGGFHRNHAILLFLNVCADLKENLLLGKSRICGLPFSTLMWYWLEPVIISTLAGRLMHIDSSLFPSVEQLFIQCILVNCYRFIYSYYYAWGYSEEIKYMVSYSLPHAWLLEFYLRRRVFLTCSGPASILWYSTFFFGFGEPLVGYRLVFEVADFLR